MNQFNRDTDDFDEGDFVKVTYDHSMHKGNVTESGVVDEIEEDDEYPTVTIRGGGGRHLRLTWNLLEYPDGAFGVKKIAFHDIILGQDGQIDLIAKQCRKSSRQ